MKEPLHNNLFLTIVFFVIFITGCDNTERRLNFPSRSMEPTIKAGSIVVMDKKSYDRSDPKRFDIVVFTPPNNPKAHYVFRIVGLPGEDLRFTGDGLLIKGVLVEHPLEIQIRPLKSGKFNIVMLNDNQFFVLGDNTNNANDSRYFGPIMRSDIIGKIMMIKQGSGTLRYLE